MIFQGNLGEKCLRFNDCFTFMSVLTVSINSSSSNRRAEPFGNIDAHIEKPISDWQIPGLETGFYEKILHCGNHATTCRLTIMTLASQVYLFQN